MGAVMKLCLERRGVNSRFQYPAPGRVEISFDMPLAEVMFDFYDRLKSVTQGYGSFDYELTGLSGRRPGQAGHPGQRREGGRPLHDRAPGSGPGLGACGPATG